MCVPRVQSTSQWGHAVMQDMSAPRAYHMCNACGLSCRGGLQDVPAPARSGLTTGQKEGKAVFQHQMVDRPPNAVMSCLDCKEYLQPIVQQTWLTGNAQMQVRTLREHNNCSVHCRSLALWETCGASTTVIGGLPEAVRNAVTGLFQLVHRMAKRGSPPAHIPGHAEAVQLVGGAVTPSYQSYNSVITITHAIAAPILSV